MRGSENEGAYPAAGLVSCELLDETQHPRTARVMRRSHEQFIPWVFCVLSVKSEHQSYTTGFLRRYRRVRASFTCSCTTVSQSFEYVALDTRRKSTRALVRVYYMEKKKLFENSACGLNLSAKSLRYENNVMLLSVRVSSQLTLKWGKSAT